MKDGAAIDWGLLRNAIASEAPLIFQVALLLSADYGVAEAALIDSIEMLPIDHDINQSAFIAQWKELVVKESLTPRIPGPVTLKHPVLGEALDPPLRKLMSLPARPKAAFVLVLLLRYPLDKAAGLLNISEENVAELLVEAGILLAEREQNCP